MKKLLEVKSLVKKYREGTRESRVVNNIDLEVEEGEFVIIMGASGSGKTSLLHLIAGIDAPDEGTIQYGRTADFGCMSESAKTIFRRKNIGIVFQQQCLIPDLTVYENMILPIMLNKKDAGKNKDVILALCNQFGLKEHIKKYPSQLSGGQQQRAAIARSLIYRPALLLADEPTGNLDQKNSREIMDMLKISNRSLEQTIILITHDEKAALDAHRIITLEDGQIISDEYRR